MSIPAAVRRAALQQRLAAQCDFATALAAAEVQAQLGDLTGLASTTEALSEVLSLCGRDAEAVTLLRDSIVFNRDKGSPLGLTGNRRAYTALAQRLAGQRQHVSGLQEAAILLTAGERELGVQQADR